MTQRWARRGVWRARCRKRRRLVLEAFALTLVAIAAVGVFAGQWRAASPRTGTGDSYWYMRGAAHFAGRDLTGTDEAAQVYCADVQRAYRLGSLGLDCTSYDVSGVPAR